MRYLLALVLLCSACLGGDAEKPPSAPAELDDEKPAAPPPAATQRRRTAKKKAEEAEPKPADEPAGKIVTGEKDIEAELKKLGLTRVGKSAFAYKDVKIEATPADGIYKVIGIMLNFGDKDLSGASFTLNVADKKGKLVATTPIGIPQMKSYEAKSFSTYLKVGSIKEVETYSIQYEGSF